MAFSTVRSKARNTLILLLTQKSLIANLNHQKAVLKIRIAESLEIFCEKTATSALKTIASQNVTSEAQIYSFFLSYIPFSSYSSFCIFNHPKFYQTCDVTMSIST